MEKKEHSKDILCHKETGFIQEFSSCLLSVFSQCLKIFSYSFHMEDFLTSKQDFRSFFRLMIDVGRQNSLCTMLNVLTPNSEHLISNNKFISEMEDTNYYQSVNSK